VFEDCLDFVQYFIVNLLLLSMQVNELDSHSSLPFCVKLRQSGCFS
jgi:hypothetical protein